MAPPQAPIQVRPPPPPPLASLPPTSVPTSAAAPPASLLTRTQKFVEENKLLVLGAGVLIASGAGYYLYTSSSNDRARKERRRRLKDDAEKQAGGLAESSSEEDVTAGGAAPGVSASGKKKKKSKKTSASKRKKGAAVAGTGTDGPLLEERSPEEVAALLEKDRRRDTSAGEEKSAEQSAAPESSAPAPAPAAPAPWLEGVPAAAELARMSPQERKTLANTLKTRGNKLYSGKKYDEAIQCYTKALEVADKEEAVFYSNRAACHQNASPPNYEKVIQDCDSALKLDTTYVKALNRRATAYEALGKEDEALRDFTATSILEKFQNETATNSVDRVLKKLSVKRAEQMMATREPRLPSSTFVASYLGAFRPRPKPEFPSLPADSMNTGNNTLSLAFDALAAANYPHAFTLCNEAIEQGITEDWKVGRAEALNMRGTFRFLLGDSQGAKEDLEKSLDLVPDYVQSLVKVASVHMELGDAAAAFGDFETAIRHDPNDPDIYYHRGQLYFVSNEFEKAAADYQKSTSLDDQFVFSHVQYAVAQYKMQQTRESMASFRKILKQFPDKYEPLNYYGELLLDQQRFDDAIEKFDSAIAIVKEQRPSNVLPFVNKALAIFQCRQDAAAAEALCKEALEIDPACDVAIATLAQLALQQGRLDEAISHFEQSAKLARTEQELQAALTYQLASQAQLSFIKAYPAQAASLGQIAQSLQS